jgi:hypothetical protein
MGWYWWLILLFITFGFAFCTGWGFGAVTAENRIREEYDFDTTLSDCGAKVRTRLKQFTKHF